ncbi:MAG TPA: MFS transporter [Kofleriaceae bacterium]|nr:MFS transporter [Kofleriaceae bacterium]
MMAPSGGGSGPAGAARVTRGGAWLVTLFTVAGLLEAALWGQMNAFVPLRLRELGVAPGGVATWTGLSTLVATAIGLGTLPLWGALADRHARKPVIVRSFVAYALGCALGAATGNLALFIAARTLMSLAMGNSGLMMATINERVSPARAGLAFAIFNSAPPLGAFLGPVIGGPLVEAHGVDRLLAVDAAVMLVLTAALAGGYRDDFVARERRGVLVLALESVGILLRSPRLRRLFPTLFCLFGGWMLANLYIALVVGARFPTAHLPTRIGWVLAGGGVATVALAPALGALGDRLGVWRVAIAVAAAEALAWPIPAFTHGIAGFLVAWALANGLASAVFALAFAALAESAPDGARGRVMAFAYLPSTGGFAIASLLGLAAPGAIVGAVFPAAAVLTALGGAGLAWSRWAPIVAAPPP